MNYEWWQVSQTWTMSDDKRHISVLCDPVPYPWIMISQCSVIQYLTPGSWYLSALWSSTLPLDHDISVLRDPVPYPWIMISQCSVIQYLTPGSWYLSALWSSTLPLDHDISVLCDPVPYPWIMISQCSVIQYLTPGSWPLTPCDLTDQLLQLTNLKVSQPQDLAQVQVHHPANPLASLHLDPRSILAHFHP